MKRKTVKFECDKDSDAAYLTLARAKVLESEQVEPGLIVDFGAEGQVVGVEILRFKPPVRSAAQDDEEAGWLTPPPADAAGKGAGEK